MREIKFRAWDEDRQEMQTSPKWVEFQVDINGVLTAENINFNKVYVPLEIMQFTGLADKNGVDIYESDVVRYKRYTDDEDHTAEVTWGFCAFVLSTSKGSHSFPVCGEWMEVIGNIHENPELKGE